MSSQIFQNPAIGVSSKQSGQFFKHLIHIRAFLSSLLLYSGFEYVAHRFGVAELLKSANVGVIKWVLCLFEVDIDDWLTIWALFCLFVKNVQEGFASWAAAALLALENFIEWIYFFISLFLFWREGDLFELFTDWCFISCALSDKINEFFNHEKFFRHGLSQTFATYQFLFLVGIPTLSLLLHW